jgi:uncharacterized protein (DUF1330 family)
MTATYAIALGIVAGAVLGTAIVQGLHAQTGPRAYLVSETETLDAVTLAAYVPLVQAALKAAGGRPAVISSIGGKVVPVVGQPPRNFVISEWESLAKAEAWLDSAEWKALGPQREKSYKTVRQFIVEMAPN